MPTHSLSPTALGTFKNCPRCFWLEKVKNIKRPRGVFPSLPGGMDAVIKAGAEGLLELRVLQLAQSAEMTIRRIKIGILAASGFWTRWRRRG